MPSALSCCSCGICSGFVSPPALRGCIAPPIADHHGHLSVTSAASSPGAAAPFSLCRPRHCFVFGCSSPRSNRLKPHRNCFCFFVCWFIWLFLCLFLVNNLFVFLVPCWASCLEHFLSVYPFSLSHIWLFCLVLFWLYF